MGSDASKVRVRPVGKEQRFFLPCPLDCQEEVWPQFRVNLLASYDLDLRWVFLPLMIPLTKDPTQVYAEVCVFIKSRCNQVDNQK